MSHSSLEIQDTQTLQKTQDSTVYYDKNAQLFYERTINIDFTELYEPFLELIKPCVRILDAGCGVGRDAQYFESLGHQVTAIDGSSEMVNLASQLLKIPAKQMFFHEMTFSEEFDAVWAAASLIHVPPVGLQDVIGRIHRALKSQGIFFATLKHGAGEYTQEGRTFYYLTESSLRPFLESQFEIIKIWTNPDLSRHLAHSPDGLWLNVLARKKDI